MKRIIAILLSVMLVISLAACAGSNTNETAAEKTDSNTEQAQTATTSDNTADNNTASSGGKTLIVYFSWSNNTDTMANYIHDRIGGDMERIEPVEAYPENYEETADLAKAQRDNNERPAFKALEYNPEDYDTIFIGYPIWWYHLPMIVRNFFESYDLSDKTIIPFVLHAGSRDGGTFREIRELEPDATVLDGLAIAGERADRAQKDVNNWLAGLSY